MPRSRLAEYAQVVKMLGNGRLEAKCQDGETRLGQIRGQLRKKVSRVGRTVGRWGERWATRSHTLGNLGISIQGLIVDAV